MRLTETLDLRLATNITITLDLYSSFSLKSVEVSLFQSEAEVKTARDTFEPGEFELSIFKSFILTNFQGYL